MSYSPDLLKYRVIVLNRKQATSSKWGKDGEGVEWEASQPIRADVTWAKGVRAMNQGALDAYGVVEVRMYWNNVVNMRSRIIFDGQLYNILPETFHADHMSNTIQFHAQVILNDSENPSSSDLGPAESISDI